MKKLLAVAALALSFILIAPQVRAQAAPEPQHKVLVAVSDGGVQTPHAKLLVAAIMKELSAVDDISVKKADQISESDPQTVDITIFSTVEEKNPDVEIVNVLFGVHEQGFEYFIYLDSTGGELNKDTPVDDLAQVIVLTAATDYGKYMAYISRVLPNKQSQPKHLAPSVKQDV